MSKRSRSGAKRDDGFVQIDAHRLLDARLVTRDLAGGDTADGDLALARTQVLDRKAGDVGGHLFDVIDAAVAQGVLGRGRDREGRVVNGLLALHGRDRDLLRRSQLESEVGGSRRAVGHPHVLPDHFAEALDIGGDRVDARHDVGLVSAVRGGPDGPRYPGLLVRDRDRGSGNRRAVRVADGSGDPSRRLGVGRRGRECEEQGEDQGGSPWQVHVTSSLYRNHESHAGARCAL